MAKTNGKGGTLLMGSTQIEISEWSLEDTANVSDSTDSADGAWNSHTIGRGMWKGSFKGFVNIGDYAHDNGAAPGESGTIHLTLNGTAEYSGTVTVTGLNVTTPVGAAETITFDGTFEGNGALTRP